MKYHSIWTIQHRRINPKTGKYQVIWRQQAIDQNILHDTGEIAILSAFFATAMANYGAPPANLYLGLDARAALAELDTLATVNAAELTAGGLGAKAGYARKAVISGGTGLVGQDFYVNQPGIYYRADSATVTWTAGENWITTLLNIFLCTDINAVADAASKHLISSLVLSTPRLLMNLDKLDGSVWVGLSE